MLIQIGQEKEDFLAQFNKKSTEVTKADFFNSSLLLKSSTGISSTFSLFILLITSPSSKSISDVWE